MKICETCHSKDKNVIGCDEKHTEHKGIYDLGNCETCGKYSWRKECKAYDTYISKK